MRAENDQRANKSYMHRWMEAAEEDQQKRTKVEQARKQKMLANQ